MFEIDFDTSKTNMRRLSLHQFLRIFALSKLAQTHPSKPYRPKD
ncbi:MAG: hypothetical protein PUJ79_05560 [Helicobacter sp.]|nr:hypothetical protein [Helicobacter sp. 10-6591]MDD7567852.1 hypothetical protein [Helicobacter sp.]MDY5739930.1 hypothetical protein [Helicobacter sp.]